MKNSFMLTGLILGFAQLAYAEPIPYPKDKELRKPIGGNGTSFVCRIEDSCTETSNIPADVPKAFIEAFKKKCIDLKGTPQTSTHCPQEKSMGFCAFEEVSSAEAKAQIEKNENPAAPLSKENKQKLIELKKSDARAATDMGVTLHYYAPTYTVEKVKEVCKAQGMMYVAP